MAPIKQAITEDRLTVTGTERKHEISAFADAVREGLTGTPKTLPCAYLYDETGSLIFEEICQVPEYYLTRSEREILLTRSDEIAALFNEPVCLVELGSGSAEKTRYLIAAFLRAHDRLRFVPIDVSRSMLIDSSQALLEQYDGLTVDGLACDYEDGLHHVKDEVDARKLFLWLGSSIGNLEREDATAFMRRIRQAAADDDRIIVGIDLRKARHILEPAYDDARGVTARFSLNLLERINRELGGEFDLESFEHRAHYNEVSGAVEISVVSLVEQEVPIAKIGETIPFGAEEPIHTERAHKYSRTEIEDLAGHAGLELERQWFDAAKRYSLNLFRPSGR